MLIYLRRELHIINDLRAKMLIKNNIIKPEGIIIDVANKKARINSYKTTIDITIRLRGGEYLRRKIYIKSSIFVLSYSEIILSTREVNLSQDRDFLFKSVVQLNLVIFAYLVNHKITGILVRNECHGKMGWNSDD